MRDCDPTAPVGDLIALLVPVRLGPSVAGGDRLELFILAFEFDQTRHQYEMYEGSTKS